jgi:UDP-glucose-4-epimerase GalE
MNVLVTGGAGYIGSQTAKHLAAEGHKPVVLDDLSRGHSWAVRWGPLVHGDISDAALVKEAIYDHQIDAVIHFAAYAYVGESMLDPGAYFENNAVKSSRLIQIAKDAGIRYFIFSSSCATYGEPQSIPISEEHPQRPVNPYGESKLFVEKVLRWYGEIHGMNWVALRYFNAAGADSGGELGESHNPETHLIPLVIEAALRADRPIRIFGSDYTTLDGTAIRDYIHVADLADAHLAALGYLRAGGESLAFNIGTGRGHSVKQVIDTVTMITGKEPVTVKEGRRKGDPPALIADPHRALEKLKWKASHSDLPNIVRTAYNWRCAQNS